MNEMPESAVPTQDRTDAPQAPATAGALLRQAREATGLHVAALAVSIRVPLKKLEALEADRHDLLPDAVFARALAASVCRALKIDPEPVLQRLPRVGAPLLPTEGAGINVPFQRPSDLDDKSFWERLPKPALLAVLLLLAGALALLFLPEGQTTATVTEPAVVVPAAAPAAGADAPVAASAGPAVSPVVPLAPAPATPIPVPAAPVPVAAAPMPAPIAAPAAPVAAVPPADAAAARHVLQLKTRGASWVEVTDAKSTVLLRRNLEPGENIGVSGTLPLAVVVGRADATEVWVRGKPFPLQGVSSENVARFEVK